MRIITTKISEVLIIEPDVYEDKRGYFFESFNQKKFDEAVGKKVQFIQDNQSHSKEGVLRGLHYQKAPMAQDKLVRVSSGRIFDVAVDIRPDSNTFTQWVGVELSAENKKQLWIPEGFAHGFLTLSATADVLYKTTNYYSSKHERCIFWSEPKIGIDWPISTEPLLSIKDAKTTQFKECNDLCVTSVKRCIR